MKNITNKNWIVALALVLMPLMSFAGGFPYVKLMNKENKVLTLRVSSNTSEQVKIYIKDQTGQTLYAENVENQEGILKIFNLKNLKSGNYSVELESSFNIEILPIQIKKDTIEIIETEFSTVYKPYIKLNQKGMIDFNLLNLNTENTSVLITDDKGIVVYKESLGRETELKKRYDVSALDKGTYHMFVQKGNRSFEQAIAL